MISTPWQVGFVSTILRALARDDRGAMKAWVARPLPKRIFGGGIRHIVRACTQNWCREALAPWADEAHPGPRMFVLREHKRTTLARFAQRGDQGLVLVIVHNGDAKLKDVCVMDNNDFEAFGETV